MNEPLPQLEPFVNCIKSLDMGNYLKSNDFKRYCIRQKFDVAWSCSFQMIKNSRGYYSMDLDHDYFDSIDTMVYFFNEMWRQNKTDFYRFSTDLLVDYVEWTGESIDIKDLVEDFELLDFPKEYQNRLLKLNVKGVPKVEIPNDIWNSSKLDDYLKKMDDSINSKDYELTLTYAYTCLEGLYKAFIRQKVNNAIETDKIIQLAVIVRDSLKNDFKTKNIDFPLSMLNLITTITNAIAESRNSFSSSHFDRDSDKWLSEFSRDCVNSIGRLILKFV
jgi:hypothetical protein